MNYDPDEALKLKNQICFPLYAAARRVVSMYTPYLKPLGLTYTQYITFMVLWEKGEMGVRELGEHLFLDSGTLTPVLKALEKKGIVNRRRSDKDERSTIISLTDDGRAIKEKAVEIPAKMGACVTLDPKDAMELYRILHILMEKM